MKRHICQSDRPEKDWWRYMRQAHHAIICERNIRYSLRRAPSNFGIVTPNWLAYAKDMLAHSRAQRPLPLP